MSRPVKHKSNQVKSYFPALGTGKAKKRKKKKKKTPVSLGFGRRFECQAAESRQGVSEEQSCYSSARVKPCPPFTLSASLRARRGRFSQPAHPSPRRLKSTLAPQFRPPSVVPRRALQRRQFKRVSLDSPPPPRRGEEGGPLSGIQTFPPLLLSLQTNAPSVLIAPPPLFMLIKSSDTEPERRSQPPGSQTPTQRLSQVLVTGKTDGLGS